MIPLNILADVLPDHPSLTDVGYEPAYLLRFLVIGYIFTVLVETPVLIAALSDRHPLRRRVLAGLWLTACTYPAFVLTLSQLMVPFFADEIYVLVGEILVAVAECSLFWAAFGTRELRGSGAMRRDMAAVVGANIASFLAGLGADQLGWFDFLK